MALDIRRLSELKDHVRHRMNALLWDPLIAERSLWRRTLVRAMQIGYAVLRDLGEGHLSLRAMGLVYYTVIAIIPLLALTFSVLKGLGAHNAMEPALLKLLEPLGDRSVEVTRNIINFVENVRVDVLSFVSLAVLLYTVLTMMQKIEMAFNFIWCVNRGRRLANRISEYLFAIIVSPLLIFLSVGISSYINTNIFKRTLDSFVFGGVILEIIGVAAAFLFMSMAFAFAYSFIPNTRVKFGSAFIGGMMTTLIWKTMGSIFKSFFANSSANEIIYLAFFTVILVMIFIYVGWLVLLTGSSIAYYHQHPTKTRIGRRKAQLSIVEQEEYALSVALLIIQRFQNKEEPWSASELVGYLRLNPMLIDDTLLLLCNIGFVKPTNEDPMRYLPTGSIENCALVEMRDQIRNYTPEFSGLGESVSARTRIRGFLDDTDKVLEHEMGKLLFSDLIANPPRAVIEDSEDSADLPER